MCTSIESFIDSCKAYAALNVAERTHVDSIISVSEEEAAERILNGLSLSELSSLSDFFDHVPSALGAGWYIKAIRAAAQDEEPDLDDAVRADQLKSFDDPFSPVSG